MLAGCSGDPAGSAQPADALERDFHEAVVRAQAEAEAGGADEAQLAILDEALTTNEITLDDEQQAVHDFGDCLDRAGFALADLQVIDDGGFKILDYKVMAGDEDTTLMDACEAKTFRWVDRLYQTQPAATRARDAHFAEELPGLIDCLREGGIAVDDDSPADEVKQAMLASIRELGSDPENGGEPTAIRCLSAAGINGF